MASAISTEEPPMHATVSAATLPLLAGFVLAQGGPADRGAGGIEDLGTLSLEELMDVEVSLVSRRGQRVGDAPAAAFVITRADIERSGLHSIPELLRLVPGMQVQRLDASRYAISARGFASQFANKLLVQMDGRTVYTPSFAGTYWDLQDLVLDDIERIEVIRGPGGANWGANAVNGIINVVTRKAGDASGGFVTTVAGSDARVITSLRHAGALDESTDYRISAKFRELASTRDAADMPHPDGLQSGLLDFRLDGRATDRTWLLRGALSQLDETSLERSPTLVAPFASDAAAVTTADAGHLLGRMTFASDGIDAASTTVQVYYDGFDRREGSAFRERRHTFDLDLQHAFAPWHGHRLTTGLSFRTTTDEIPTTARVLPNDEAQTRNLGGLFVRDEWQLVDDRLAVAVGVKLEHNDFTGLETQPELRLAFTPAADTLLWASVARAVRTPNRAEDDLVIATANQAGPGGSTLVTNLQPNRSLEAEQLLAVEAGVRGKLASTLAADLSLFWNDYDDVIGYVPGTPVPGAPPAVVVPATTSNAVSVRNYGAEATATWQADDGIQVAASYSLLQQVDLEVAPGAISPIGLDSFPRHQGTLRAQFQLAPEVDLDLQAFYVDRLRDQTVDAYVRLDLLLSWRCSATTRFQAGGQNLLDDRHAESPFEFVTVPSEIERAFFFAVTHTF
jgi:iron complex outermembrane receptor protein